MMQSISIYRAPGQAMKLTIIPLSRSGIEAITSWRYEPPYDIYNLAHPPSAEAVGYFQNPAFAYHEIQDEAGEIVGFCSFGADGQVPGGDYSQEALDIGMGMRPDLTGQGLGSTVAATVVDFAVAQYAPSMLRVTIAAFNHRAQRVWLKMGFQHTERFGREADQMPFIVLSRSLG